MKKVLCIVLCFIITAGLLTGCGSKANNNNNSSDVTNNASVNTKTDTSLEKLDSPVMKTNLSQAEYTLYQNIFYNNQKGDYAGKSVEKEGTFATLYDAFNKVERYYVWGYMDNTKCCDWQWEIKLDDGAKKPTNGSYVKVKGTYEENDDALDKFWIIDPVVTVVEEYADRGIDVDMCSMSETLLYVEIQNIINIPDYFEGKTVCGYGRMQTDSAIQDAYYDNKWSVEIDTDGKIPAFGSLIVFTGKVAKTSENRGTLTDVSLYQNTQY